MNIWNSVELWYLRVVWSFGEITVQTFVMSYRSFLKDRSIWLSLLFMNRLKLVCRLWHQIVVPYID